MTNDTTVEITELPVGMRTQKYKEIIETLLEGYTKKDDGKSSQFSVKHNVTIKHFTENHTDTAVSFTLTFSAEKFAEAEKVGIIKVFKLESSISVANMHLLDAKCRKKYTGPQESRERGIIFRDLYNHSSVSFSLSLFIACAVGPRVDPVSIRSWRGLGPPGFEAVLSRDCKL